MLDDAHRQSVAYRLRFVSTVIASATLLATDDSVAQSVSTNFDKLIRVGRRDDVALHYFDLKADPTEQRQLETGPRIATLNQIILDLNRASGRRGAKASTPIEHVPAEIEQLEALGYLDP